MTAHEMPPVHLTIVDVARASHLSLALRKAFDMALEGRSQLPLQLFAVPGFSGRKFRMFLNNLMSIVPAPRYLEIGVLAGASFIPAVYGNQDTGTAVDNWSWEGANVELFKKYLADYCSDSSIAVVNSDFRSVDFARLGRHNVMFYDGSHAESDQLDGVKLPTAAMDSAFISIVDDWNWEHVRRGTFAGLREAGCRIDFMIEVRTTIDNRAGVPALHGAPSDWHNGMFAAVVCKV